MSGGDVAEKLKVERIVWRAGGDEALLMGAFNLTREPPVDHLTTNEDKAADKAVEELAEWLAGEVGSTDLAELTEEQMYEFKRRMICGYRAALWDIVKSEPPF
ncbi:hypothetical protein L1787_12995 [Acuticoccus sp. M5D2P5]|uniref:hypothetical protein n=1 Tax=Acuticoccus kalidii TaxID=2910977 RepID=UPI001F25834E|nr:hypothetical protein [Acuticoccus kalidii]MCF3934326.1 hypothetical protein [Acuticoccus kalidii]